MRLSLSLNMQSHLIGAHSGASNVWRGLSQNMRTAVQGKNGGTNISVTSRTRHYSNVPFRRFRLVIPVFEIIGTPLVDTLFTGSQVVLNFQWGFEYPFTNAVTGLAARIPVTFSGVNWVRYDNATWDANLGYLISDVIDAGQMVTAGSFFGLWGTVEVPSGAVNNVLPYTLTGSNFNDRWIGQSFSASSRIVGVGGASDFAISSTSITKLGTTQAGASGIFTPSLMLIEVPRTTKCVGVIGDSIAYGNNEGQAGSSTFGDSMGSALGNAGYVDRGIYEVANLIGVNLGKGSDGSKYVTTAANWKYRRQLLTLANPTHVINENIHNDVTATITIVGWAAATAYAKYDVKSSSSNLYMCEQAGTSGSTTLSGTGSAIVDGSCIWRFLGPLPGTANPRGWAQIFAWIASVNDQIKVALPAVKIIQATCTPDATSTDSWATTANQTPATGWGDGTSRRGLINAEIRAKNARLSITSVIEPNLYLEDSYPTETSKWVVNGAANYATQDGTHHNSKGADLAKAAVTADKFA